MTKKTDSLIFRYGIQTLWKNTNFLFKTSVSNSFFFKFFKFELKKRNFELLSIEQKKNNILSVFVFCFFWKNVISKTTKKQSVLLFKILLFYKYWFLFQVLYSLFYILTVQKFKTLNITFLLYLTAVDSFFSFKNDYNYMENAVSLQTLFFKVEQLRLESLLSSAFNRHFVVKLYNVFNLPLYFDFIKLSTRSTTITSTPNLSTLEFMLYLSCKLRMVSIFTRYLAKSLELENKHRKVLWSAVNAINLLRTKLVLFKSMRIYVTGKLNGKMRSKTYSFRIGRLALQQIKSNLDYFKATSFTKFGTISVKVWIFF